MNRLALGAAVAATLLIGCSSNDSSPDAAPEPEDTPATSPVDSANAPCRGTLSGAASGAFTCDSHALLFLPGYDSAALLGNTEVTLLSEGTPPAGIQRVVWAGVLPGALAPGSYTEKQLLQGTGLSAEAIIFEDNSLVGGVKRLKLEISKVEQGSEHEDIVTKRGSTRDDHVSGSLELVLGDDTKEIVVSATLK